MSGRLGCLPQAKIALKLLAAVLVSLTVAACARPPVATPPSASPTASADATRTTNDEYSMLVSAQGKASSFSRLLDGGSYDRIWQDTDDILRRELSKEQFVAYLEEIHRTLGQSGKSTLVGFQFEDRKGADAGTYLFMRYDTAFATGPAQELFVWRVTPSNLVTLVQYKVARVAPSPSLRG